MQGVKRPCIPALRVWALHQHQGYASPAPSPGPLATLAAAASGPALDADSGARSTSSASSVVGSDPTVPSLPHRDIPRTQSNQFLH
ncbi:Hypothetical protein PSEBR_m1609 [Pseudomonas brassicacearum subsp. brassicacearum NFM421]|uniref:Uncharacterized protein n=1 Tax=Pseudomonas brassicacearum (strain NFM421) TaxID=994484 RepID=F2KM70_PSEBN|nr:Hypothetical protein PSEBR_m1609 [Pseudomonas brassicacearum subsp. brassicacearum NFM421]